MCLLCYDTYRLLQLEDGAKRHRPWPHTDWLSLHPSKGIREADGAVVYSEENEDDAGLQDGYYTSLQ